MLKVNEVVGYDVSMRDLVENTGVTLSSKYKLLDEALKDLLQPPKLHPDPRHLLSPVMM